MIDQAAVDACVNGIAFALFFMTAAWSILWIVHFVKSLLNGVTP